MGGDERSQSVLPEGREDFMGVIHRNSVAELVLSDQGQMFAGVATIRAAIFDVIDGGFNRRPWTLDPDDESDAQTAQRFAFADAVIAIIADLQSPPFNHIQLQNLCEKHKRAMLPVPTAAVCGMCQVERGTATDNDPVSAVCAGSSGGPRHVGCVYRNCRCECHARRVFIFLRDVAGQPPFVWKKGHRLIIDPSEPNPIRVMGNVVGWNDMAGGQWFKIGSDVQETTS